MAYINQTTAHDVGEIKIIKTKGQTVEWYSIYLDNVHLCAVFGIDKKLPEIITYYELDILSPPHSEKDT